MYWKESYFRVTGEPGAGGIAFAIFPVRSECQVDNVFHALLKRPAGCTEVSRIFSPEHPQTGFHGVARRDAG